MVIGAFFFYLFLSLVKALVVTLSEVENMRFEDEREELCSGNL